MVISKGFLKDVYYCQTIEEVKQILEENLSPEEIEKNIQQERVRIFKIENEIKMLEVNI